MTPGRTFTPANPTRCRARGPTATPASSAALTVISVYCAPVSMNASGSVMTVDAGFDGHQFVRRATLVRLGARQLGALDVVGGSAVVYHSARQGAAPEDQHPHQRVVVAQPGDQLGEPRIVERLLLAKAGRGPHPQGVARGVRVGSFQGRAGRRQGRVGRLGMVADGQQRVGLKQAQGPAGLAVVVGQRAVDESLELAEPPQPFQSGHGTVQGLVRVGRFVVGRFVIGRHGRRHLRRLVSREAFSARRPLPCRSQRRPAAAPASRRCVRLRPVSCRSSGPYS